MTARRTLTTLMTILAIAGLSTRALADERALVDMAPPMQEHLLGNMRDHLHALDDILAALADDDAGRAGEIAEARLGLSSLDNHGAAHMAPFMPEGMRAIGTELHHAASRFSQAATNADVEQTVKAQRTVFAALQNITATCNACHDGYRIR